MDPPEVDLSDQGEVEAEGHLVVVGRWAVAPDGADLGVGLEGLQVGALVDPEVVLDPAEVSMEEAHPVEARLQDEVVLDTHWQLVGLVGHR